jgi:hypothetical protein
MHADAKQTDVCVYLSVILPLGLVLNAALGWWWADPAAAGERLGRTLNEKLNTVARQLWLWQSPVSRRINQHRSKQEAMTQHGDAHRDPSRGRDLLRAASSSARISRVFTSDRPAREPPTVPFKIDPLGPPTSRDDCRPE